MDGFYRIQYSLGKFNDPLAISWSKNNLPYLIAKGLVISSGNSDNIITQLRPMLPIGTEHSINNIEEMEHLSSWVYGIHLVRQGDVTHGIEMLEHSLRLANRIYQAEGRAGLKVGLGDALWCQGRHDKAKDMWQQSLLEKPEFLNYNSRRVAIIRLNKGGSLKLELNQIHFPFDRRTWIP